MELSKFLLNTTSITIDALFKTTKSRIITSGIEKIPNQPSLFVVNHFTRMETFFLPAIIQSKFNKKYSISMAHYSFFGGSNLGRILSKLGAISTKDPNRDKIFIHTLLTGAYNTVIFPEGQMIKDKKLIEKGKLMIYNAGINATFTRRPPHTGAARLALLAQFYREKIIYFQEQALQTQLDHYKQEFDLSDKDIKNLIQKETNIIPVNISYYPIRSKNNILNRLADRFVGKLPKNVEEEIELEGAMIFEGVDININFGAPISVKECMHKHKKTREIIANNELYLDKSQVKKELPFLTLQTELMQDFMKSIYKLVTVNYDHIFAYILKSAPWNTFKESALKNKAFLAIEKLKELENIYMHSSLTKNQFHLLTDDEHERYRSFIEAATSEKLITVKDGYITRHKKRFNKAYNFYFVRKDNIVEILKNELEPLSDVIKIFKKIMRTPPCFDKKKIRKHFLTIDKNLFERDYEKYHTVESKPKDIGRPFLLRESIKKGVILVHGYMAAPEEMRVLAEYLQRKGYTVYCARLRGHGTSPEDLCKRSWLDWYRSVNRAYIIMENLVKQFAIIGFSTGAGLSLLQAAKKGDKFKGVVAINPPMKLQNIASRFSSAVTLWNSLLTRMKISKGAKKFVINEPENPHINYFKNPICGVQELGKLMRKTEEHLKDITIPSLIIQGSDDPVVNPAGALPIFTKIGSTDKELYRIYSKRHGIVRGEEFEKVSKRIEEFLQRVFS